MSITLHTYLSDVTGVTIKDVSGDGHQVELLIGTRKDGVVAVRLIGAKARVIRVTDIRHRGRKGKHPIREHAVPFTEIAKKGK